MSTLNHAPCWIALHLPHLALDEILRGQAAQRALAIVIANTDRNRPSVIDCSPAAARSGIRRGMPVSSALALDQVLAVRVRDADSERRCLRRLAGWCYQYSSEVSIWFERNTLLLEAAASERLFGEPDALCHRLGSELGKLGYHARAGMAPTPAAARLAADNGLTIASVSGIRARISTLPLDCLEIATPQCVALQRMGFSTIGEILRLPRKGLARRLGPGVVDYLDRLLGHKPDPLPLFRPDDSFSAGLDLVAGVIHSEALLFALKRLVTELCGALQARDRGIQQLTVRLRHEDRRESGIHLGLQQPTRDPDHLMMLLRERLERLRLPREVHHVHLDAPRLLPFEAAQVDLFGMGPDTGSAPVAPLLERLRARLGDDSVKGLLGVEDHRPEYSWSLREPGEPARCTALPHRPVWLLPRPEKCHIDDYRILAGPERIESGWWSGDDRRRDYFVVQDRDGGLLWAFHEYKPRQGWYLHGVFS